MLLVSSTPGCSDCRRRSHSRRSRRSRRSGRCVPLHGIGFAEEPRSAVYRMSNTDQATDYHLSSWVLLLFLTGHKPSLR
ncbi:hypothetical protein M0802_014388 [Mischocyttarus mexicanus]|nr:hypothetical protein M0802_014388 [Mischocyttarus mexicanus]